MSHLNSERSARLERAQVLLGQFWETYEELSPWIEEMQTTISQLPPPAVDHDMLRQQQEEIRVGHLIFFLHTNYAIYRTVQKQCLISQDTGWQLDL